MALEDRDLFMAICARFPDQQMDFIMAQYEKAKRLNMSIEKRISEDTQVAAQAGTELEIVEFDETAAETEAPKKRYTKRMLKVKPDDAITEDAIFCCICAEPKQSLTKKHLNTHGISVEDYKKLCGYAPKTPLMSLKRLEKSKEVIARAQKARLQKRMNEAEQ